MAGFFLWHDSESFEPNEINETFISLDYSKGSYLSHGGWNVMVFPKTAYKIKNYVEYPNGYIFGTGTFGYKGKVYEKALPEIFDDITANKLRLNEFWGSFLVFCCFDNKAILIRDGAMLARLQGIKSKPIFSTSFIGLLRASKNKLDFDREAATELLSTGLITGNSTIIKQIEFIVYREELNGIKCLHSETPYQLDYKTKHEALKHQVEIAKEFTSRLSNDWFEYCPDSHQNVSITGGLDSRLLTALLLKKHRKFNFYTYWRDQDSTDQDFIIAKQIADFLDIELRYEKVSQSIALSDNELANLFISAHNSSDGVIRPGTFWDEEFSTIDYRSKLSNHPYLRVTGFEGEYYRNMERLPLTSSRSHESWVRWEMIYRFAGNNFTSKRAQKQTEDRILQNIKTLLGNGHLDLLNHKKYYREAVVPSYRSLQTNIENRFGFLVSPFADTNLSLAAIAAYPFLGNSLQFEVDMLKEVSPELAGLPNDYGFNFFTGESDNKHLITKLWQIIPPNFKHRIFTWYRGNYFSPYVKDLTEKSNFIKKINECLLSVELPVDMDKVAQRSVRGKITLNLGFFLFHNEKWLSW
jgi:hypothetical protein